MKIIDAHIHFCPGDPYFTGIAVPAGHQNTAAHLAGCMQQYHITSAIVMGNRDLTSQGRELPDFLYYCAGLDRTYLDGHSIADSLDILEEHLRSPRCVGIKLYPGYHHCYVSDPVYDPVFDLARFYEKPVAVHTGITAGNQALLKYAHPLSIDEAASKWNSVRFVLCHFGNPWLDDAAAVLIKNRNVSADLSGFLEGQMVWETFQKENEAYLQYLRMWIRFAGFSRFLYGTDWPLANMENCISFVQSLIPESHWQEVFYSNASDLYGIHG